VEKAAEPRLGQKKKKASGQVSLKKQKKSSGWPPRRPLPRAAGKVGRLKAVARGGVKLDSITSRTATDPLSTGGAQKPKNASRPSRVVLRLEDQLRGNDQKDVRSVREQEMWSLDNKPP